jgi:NADPH:quinone reductase
VLVWEEIQVGLLPGPGEARVRHTAVGVNFVDVHIRKGLYPVPLSSRFGTEAVGIVREIGPGVTEVKVGDRIASAVGPLGACAEERPVPADRLFALPRASPTYGLLR